MSDKPHVVTLDQGDVDAQSKVLAAAPTKEQLVAEFGEQGLTTNPDGSWDYNLPKKDGKVERRTLQRAREMDQNRQRAEMAAGDRGAQKMNMVNVRDERGNKISVPEHHAERVDRMMFERRRNR